MTSSDFVFVAALAHGAMWFALWAREKLRPHGRHRAPKVDAPRL
ncbi:hypothetical protein [Streptomyces demainii]|uniref:Uncharacterized protein n=1 Tax=Streptomyces demainii TaxID=588122 RepID=A0ABT9KSV0_9ACTN|nr:hypothetical protein [Streptomyces demainii]MDP9611522.1 hypothetical protein [Streptomyces demainii]